MIEVLTPLESSCFRKSVQSCSKLDDRLSISQDCGWPIEGPVADSLPSSIRWELLPHLKPAHFGFGEHFASGFVIQSFPEALQTSEI